MITQTIPGPLSPRHRERRSRALLHWRADDYAVQALAGPALTFARAGANGGLVRDVAGRGRFPSYGAPRFHCFDLDGDGIFEAPALLIEQRNTNLLLRSQEFDNASWTKTRATVSANAVMAPDGTTTADKLVEDATASNTHFLSQAVTLAGGAGKRFAVSVFARAGERTDILLRGTDATNSFQAVFSLSSGAVTSSATAGTGVHVRSYVETWLDWLGFTWYRCVVVGTAGAVTANVQGFVMLVSGGTNTYTGDGASGVYLWGAQLEETDNDATTYLATTSATVQRDAEALTASWLLAPGPLTMYVDLVEIGQAIDIISSKRLVQIGDGTTRTILLQGSTMRAEHDNGPTSVSSAPVISGVSRLDRLEGCAALDTAGRIQASYALNGGAAVVGVQSGAAAFASAYGGSPAKVAIGSQEGNASWGVLAFRAVKIAAGVRTMQDMRELL